MDSKDNQKKKLIIDTSIYFILIITIVLLCVFLIKGPNGSDDGNTCKLNVTCNNCSVLGKNEIHEIYGRNKIVNLEFKANDGCSLPGDVYFSVNGKQQVKDIDYSYSQSSGALSFTILAETNIEINGDPVIYDNLSFVLTSNEYSLVSNTYSFEYGALTPSKVDWGDGTIDTCKTHTYTPSTEDHTVTIYNYSYPEFILYTASIRPASSSLSSIKEIHLSNSIKSIYKDSFDYPNLKKLYIPSSVTYIDPEAFVECSSLEEIKISEENNIYDSRENSNAIIEKKTNKLIIGSNNTIIPNSVTSIGDYAFSHRSSLTSISIPNGVTSIGNNAFENCSSLTSITIPDTVNYIGEKAFSGCSFESINIPNGVSSIKNETFFGCRSLSSIVIPDSVTSIGDYAFGYCSSLSSIYIPSSVAKIGNSVFYECSSLQYNKKGNDLYLGNNVNPYLMFVSGGENDCIVDENCKFILNYAFCKEGYTKISIPNSIVSINNYAFDDYYNYPYNGKNNLLYIGSDENPYLVLVKSKNNKITSSSIENGCKFIHAEAFSDCKSLTSIVVPETIVSIGKYAFNNCIKLSSISIPSSVKSISDYAFNNCSSLVSVSLLSISDKISDSLFSGCSSLTSVALNDNVASIESFAFSDCISLKTINIPSSLKHIGGGAFGNCSSLASINIPNSVLRIDAGAFSGCSLINSINIPNGVISLHEGVFDGCELLNDVILPESIIYLSYDTFGQGKTGLNLDLSALNRVVFTRYFLFYNTFSTIKVKKELLVQYKTSAYWSSFASCFVGV